MAHEQQCIQVKVLNTEWQLLGKLMSEWLSLKNPLDSKYYLTFFQYIYIYLSCYYRSHGKHTENQERGLGNNNFLCTNFHFIEDCRICGKHADYDPAYTNGWHVKPWQILGHLKCVIADIMFCIWISAKYKPFLSSSSSQQQDGVRGCKSWHL